MASVTSPSQPAPAPLPRVVNPAYQVLASKRSGAGSAVGFGFVLVYLFQLISRVTEYIDSRQQFHLVLIVAGIAVVGALASLSFTHAFDNRIGLMLAAFTAWAIFELPFSSWRGGSFYGLVNSWLKSYVTYIIVVSLIGNLAQLRKAVFCIAAATATIAVLSFGLGIQSEADDRLSLAVGSLSNANDLAMELLIGLPFLIYVGMDKKRNKVVRVISLLFAPLVLSIILKTGSRSGVIALIVMALIAFLRVGMMMRIKMAALGFCLLLIAPFVISQDLKERYGTILSGTSVLDKNRIGDASDVQLSAALSETARKELMMHALILTARHPIFGVGMDQFAAASAEISTEQHDAPMWHVVHSFLLLVMSETGIPGVLLYSAAFFFCLTAVFSAAKIAKGLKDSESLAGPLAETLIVTMVGFLAFMLFSPGAYLFQFPLMAALATVLYRSMRDAAAKPDAVVASGLRGLAFNKVSVGSPKQLGTAP